MINAVAKSLRKSARVSIKIVSSHIPTQTLLLDCISAGGPSARMRPANVSGGIFSDWLSARHTQVTLPLESVTSVTFIKSTPERSMEAPLKSPRNGPFSISAVNQACIGPKPVWGAKYLRLRNSLRLLVTSVAASIGTKWAILPGSGTV
jgi:hypothetical protein